MCNPGAAPRVVASVFPLVIVEARSGRRPTREGDDWWFSIEPEPIEAGTRLAVYARNVTYDDRMVDRFFTVERAMVRGDVSATPAVIQYPVSEAISRLGPAAEFVGVKSGERIRLGEITVRHPRPLAGAPEDTLELVIRARTLDARMRLEGDVVVPHLGR